ncbi:helix-turn-helix domain-containing protein [Planomonospora alba]|uniref:Helix-turn-helix domain-containing protein n=1 Tax=Planomonospora alba TaxID=161354 RepID=A0ABP6NCQ1_9ACTN
MTQMVARRVPQALPRTCCAPATLWLGPGRALYAGPSFELRAHSGSVACLAVGLDEAFTVDIPGRPARTARSALIAPRVRHRLVARGRMVFCYLDAASFRGSSCAGLMTGGDGVLGLHHRHQRRLLRIEPGHDWLDAAAPPGAGRCDPRIGWAAGVLRSQTHRTVSAGELADGCGLSVSRFLHLFAACTGTSFRRYRLWARMLRVAEFLADGGDLTTAATGAGFATPSHFSDAFHRMFGLRPSRLLAAGVTIVRPQEGPPGGSGAAG